MSFLLRAGEVLKGRIGSYTIAKQVSPTLWLAKDQGQRKVVIKGGPPTVGVERDALKMFQHCPHIRPMVDEMDGPSAMPPLIALRYLDSDVLTASIERKLSREELKYVTRRLLLALSTLHEKGYVHSDVKTNNIFFNSQEGPNRFADVQLGDLGDCCTVDSERARSGKLVGAPVWSSPEVILEMPWNTATDIWSFGTVVISLIYGGDRNLFQPQDVKRGEQGYLLGVLERQFRYFGPFLPPFIEMGDGGIAQVIQYLMETIPYDELTPFASVTEGQVAKKDRNFISKIMQLDWRDRPTAKELLEDEWWQDD